MVAHGVHHGVPVAAEIGSDFRHGSAVMADLERRPTTSPVGHPGSLDSDAVIDLHEGDDRACRVRASPS